jgi:hypothetical protein
MVQNFKQKIMFSEWLVKKGFVTSVDTIESELTLDEYNTLYEKYLEKMKKAKSLPRHRVLMIAALTHLYAGNKKSAKKTLLKAKKELDEFYDKD